MAGGRQPSPQSELGLTLKLLPLHNGFAGSGTIKDYWHGANLCLRQHIHWFSVMRLVKSIVKGVSVGRNIQDSTAGANHLTMHIIHR